MSGWPPQEVRFCGELRGLSESDADKSLPDDVKRTVNCCNWRIEAGMALAVSCSLERCLSKAVISRNWRVV